MGELKDTKGMTRRDFLQLATGVAAGLFLPISPLPRRARAEVPSLSSVHFVPIPPEDVEAYFEGLSLYWGDIHGHTGFSDGYGLPGEYFRRAMNQQKLDFAAISDHAEAMLLFEKAFPRRFSNTPSLWEKSIDALQNAYIPGQFVTIPAFEWTSVTYGHRNVYFRDVDHLPENPLSSFDCFSPDDLWQALDQGGYEAFTVPHHPAWILSPMDWSFFNERERLVEIYSKHGSSESFLSDYEPFAEFLKFPLKKLLVINRFVAGALLQGHKLGIISSTDTHQGLAGSMKRNFPRGISLKMILQADDDAELLEKLQEKGLTLEQFEELLGLGFTWDYREPPGGNGGLCAVWAPDLVREEIWDAMWNRTTYGTSGIKPRVQFVLRDSDNPEQFTLMGGEIAIGGKPELLVNIVTDSTSSISRILLSRRGKVLLDQPVTGEQVSFKLVDEEYGQEQSSVFYTLKIEFLQERDRNSENDWVLLFDGDRYRFGGPQLDERTWVSPIWINGEM